jgi:hypothetical protein
MNNEWRLWDALSQSICTGPPRTITDDVQSQNLSGRSIRYPILALLSFATNHPQLLYVAPSQLTCIISGYRHQVLIPPPRHPPRPGPASAPGAAASPCLHIREQHVNHTS